MAPKKDKAPPPLSKPAKSGGGKQKMKKWSKGKQKEKVNNMVLFDKATCDKLLSENPLTSMAPQRKTTTVSYIVATVIDMSQSYEETLQQLRNITEEGTYVPNNISNEMHKGRHSAGSQNGARKYSHSMTHLVGGKGELHMGVGPTVHSFINIAWTSARAVQGLEGAYHTHQTCRIILSHEEDRH
ncbi:hypothetical protein LguiB_005504 [Lonicera macranthoides]